MPQYYFTSITMWRKSPPRFHRFYVVTLNCSPSLYALTSGSEINIPKFYYRSMRTIDLRECRSVVLFSKVPYLFNFISFEFLILLLKWPWLVVIIFICSDPITYQKWISGWRLFRFPFRHFRCALGEHFSPFTEFSHWLFQNNIIYRSDGIRGSSIFLLQQIIP